MPEKRSLDLAPKKPGCGFWIHLDRADAADGRVATGSMIEALDIGKNIT
jgi:hypothetical protein